MTAPAWNILWIFPAIAVAMFIVALAAARMHDPPLRLSAPLSRLDAGWSLTSWVTNITAIGGVLTAVFGASGAASTLLGGDDAAKPAIALATVGAAVALGFVAAGPVLLGIFTKDDHVTGLGIIAAASMTLAGAVDELIVVARAATDPGIANDLHMVWVAAAVGTILLLVYGYRMTTGTIIQGLPLEVTTANVEIVEAHLASSETPANVGQAFRAVRRVALAPTQARRSALL